MMRRVMSMIVLVGGIAVLPGTAIAQTVQGGVKGGVTLGTVPNFGSFLNAGAEAEDERLQFNEDFRRGFVAGGLLTINLSNFIAFQPEVLYAQRGQRFADPDSGEERELKLDYIDIPLLARVQMSRHGGVYLLVGPSFNINRKALLFDEDITGELLQKQEISVVAGVGVEFLHMLLEARYSKGLTDLIVVPAGFEGVPVLRNQSVTVLFGFRFP